MATQATGDIFINDAFTGSTDDALETYDADWSDVLAVATPFFSKARITAADRVRSDGSGTIFAAHEYVHAASPSSDEYDIRCSIYVASNESGGQVGVMGRASGDPVFSGDPAYLAWYDQSSGEWQLILTTDASVLGSYAQALSVGNTYALELRIRDGEQEVLIDSVSRITAADTSVTGAGNVYIYGVSPGGTDSVGYHLDNLIAQDVTGGATAYPPIEIWVIG